MKKKLIIFQLLSASISFLPLPCAASSMEASPMGTSLESLCESVQTGLATGARLVPKKSRDREKITQAQDDFRTLTRLYATATATASAIDTDSQRVIDSLQQQLSSLRKQLDMCRLEDGELGRAQERIRTLEEENARLCLKRQATKGKLHLLRKHVIASQEQANSVEPISLLPGNNT